MDIEQTADRIYRSLFGAAAPEIIVSRFAGAYEQHKDGFSEEDRRLTGKALAAGGDLEALEMAARWRKRLPLLVWGFRVMARLGETRPENRARLINDGDHRIRALLALCGAGLRSGWKLIKGLFLLRRAASG